jgi:hypothetical protein
MITPRENSEPSQLKFRGGGGTCGASSSKFQVATDHPRAFYDYTVAFDFRPFRLSFRVSETPELVGLCGEQQTKRIKFSPVVLRLCCAFSLQGKREKTYSGLEQKPPTDQ